MPSEEFLLSTRHRVLARAQLTIAIGLVLIATTAVAVLPDSYIFRDGDVTWMLGKGMPAENLKAIQTRYGHEFIWARRNGRIFISHDADLIDQARGIVNLKTSRNEQERRLAAALDLAIRRGVAQPVE